MRLCWRATQRWRQSSGRESGITQVELLVAVVLAVVLLGAAFGYVQVGLSANSRVSAQARYGQGLALAVNQIIDGSGNAFLGLRGASSIQNRLAGGFEFRYPVASHTESYWISGGELFRSADGSAAQSVTKADSLHIDSMGSSGFYTVRLSAGADGGQVVEYSTRVRLRNGAK